MEIELVEDNVSAASLDNSHETSAWNKRIESCRFSCGEIGGALPTAEALTRTPKMQETPFLTSSFIVSLSTRAVQL